jgi:MFS family permease
MFGLAFFSIMSMLTLLPFLLEDYYALEEAAVGFIMGAIPLCGMSGSIVSYIAGKFLKPFSFVRWAMIPYALVLGLTISLAFTYQYVSDLFWPVLLACIPMIALSNIFIPVAMTLALEDMEGNAGFAQGIVTFTQSFLMAAGSLMATTVWNGSPSSFYTTLAIGMALTSVWFFVWCRPPTASGKLQGTNDTTLECPCEQSVSAASSPCQEQV